MADSLLDFGNIAQLAQNNLRNAMQMQQMGMQEENLQLHREQQKINQQNANTEYINTLGNFLKDERVKYDPKLEGAIINKISALAGGPEVDFGSIQVGRQAKVDYVNGLISGDAEMAASGLRGFAATASIDQLDNLVKTTAQYPKLQEEVLAMKQAREENAEKFETLQQNNARVALGRPLYTALSSGLRDQLKITESKDFKVMQNLYDKAKLSGGDVAKLLGSGVIPGVNKQALGSLLNGNFGEVARSEAEKVTALRGEIDKDQRTLDDADHGVPLPSGVTKAMLRARIETNSTLAGALQSMQEWHEEPFDKRKHTAAMGAARAIEAQRLKIEELDKNTHADTIRIQQETLAAKQEENRLKHEQEGALAEAQRRFLALPEKQRNGAAAGRISKAIQEEFGVDVLPSKIYEDPNKPASQVTVNNPMARGLGTKAADRIDKGANVAEQAVKKITTVNRMLDAIEKDNVNLGPGATVQQYMGQLASKMGVAGKTTDERIQNTRTIIQGLADMVLANREQLEGQGQVSNYESQLAERAATPGEINQFTIPELKTILSLADRSARFEYGLHENRMKVLRDDPDESIRREARIFEAPPLPKSRFEGKPSASPSGKAAPKAPQPAPAPYKDQGKEERYQKWLKEHPEFQ